MSWEPIRFHEKHSSSICLSENGAVARKLRSELHVGAICFTNRPIEPQEKLLLTIEDNSSGCALGVGFSEKDPHRLDLSRITWVSGPEFNEESGVWGPTPIPDGCYIKERSEFSIYMEKKTNRVMIKKEGSNPTDFSGFRAKKPVYVVFARYIGESTFRISSTIDSHSLPESTILGTSAGPVESYSFPNFSLDSAYFTPQGEVGGPLSRIEGGEDLYSSFRGNFAIVDTPIKAGCAIIVKLTALNQISPLGMALTADDTASVRSKRSLEELCDSTYALIIDSETPEIGDELAVRISPSGAVHISHNNRGWLERTHVDPVLEYHVVFDMKHISVLSMIGIATGLGEVGGDPAVYAPSAPPESREGVSSECVICYENARNVAIKPCSHVALCEGCAHTLRRSDRPDCPICRARITDIQKLYFS